MYGKWRHIAWYICFGWIFRMRAQFVQVPRTQRVVLEGWGYRWRRWRTNAQMLLGRLFVWSSHTSTHKLHPYHYTVTNQKWSPLLLFLGFVWTDFCERSHVPSISRSLCLSYTTTENTRRDSRHWFAGYVILCASVDPLTKIKRVGQGIWHRSTFSSWNYK